MVYLLTRCGRSAMLYCIKKTVHMDYLPIFLTIQGKPCLVVGGGEIATRKVNTLLKAGGNVTVMSLELTEELRAFVEAGRIDWLTEPFDSESIGTYSLVVAATSDTALNEKISEAIRSKHGLINVVDNPKYCNFIFPAIVDRTPLVLAISSGGAAPVLVRQIRTRLEALIPCGYGRLAQWAKRWRQRVRQTLSEPSQRRKLWEALFDDRMLVECVLQNRIEEANAHLEKHLDATISSPKKGIVFLVGAGPGDPDLLTLRALRLIQEADVVVYDRLVSKEIIALIRQDAEKIHVGKQSRSHTLPQRDINQLLATLARQGKRVVRLKGGDPLLFGRGGEEIETLAAEEIPFQIVPGITAAFGCAAYAGIPLTHRDYAQSCTFLTGHLQENRLLNPDWKQWVRPNQTLIFYMSLQSLSELCTGLIEHGCPDDWPAALIQQGTTPQQKVLTGTLSTLPDIVSCSEVKAPTLLIVGKVVELRQKLDWFRPGPVEQDTSLSSLWSSVIHHDD